MIYEGLWNENLPSGHGKEIYNKYYKYEGEFLNGLKHGRGMIEWYKDDSMYEGEFYED